MPKTRGGLACVIAAGAIAMCSPAALAKTANFVVTISSVDTIGSYNSRPEPKLTMKTGGVYEVNFKQNIADTEFCVPAVIAELDHFAVGSATVKSNSPLTVDVILFNPQATGDTTAPFYLSVSCF